MVERINFIKSIITRANTGTPAPRFKYIIFRGDAVISEFQSGASTIVGQANAAGAIAVGAINYFKTPAFTSATPVIASYSSIGGTKIGAVDRNKPDITAPDGVNTSVNMGPDYSGDADPSLISLEHLLQLLMLLPLQPY